MPALAKICGLTTPESVAASLAGGATFLGFMFFPASPRDISPATAGRLAFAARGRANIVAVLADPADWLVDAVAAGLKPDLIQLHGAETPARARDIARRAGAGIIKAIAVGDAGDLRAAADFEPVVDHLLFDARPAPGTDRPGGLGERFDWALLAGYSPTRAWFLAGGLDPWNVADAIRRSGAPMVDVSSGVERGPGLKDEALIGAFMEATRRV